MTTKHSEAVLPIQGPVLMQDKPQPLPAIYSQPLEIVKLGGDVTLSVNVARSGWFSVEGSFDVAQSWTYQFLQPTRLAPGPQQVAYTTATPQDPYSGCTHLRFRWEPDPVDSNVRVEYLSGNSKFHPSLPAPRSAGGISRLVDWVRLR